MKVLVVGGGGSRADFAIAIPQPPPWSREFPLDEPPRRQLRFVCPHRMEPQGSRKSGGITMRFSRRSLLALVILGVTTGGILATATSAAAHCGKTTGDFCAYQDAGYAPTPPLLHSAAGVGTSVDVTDNLVSSAKNGTFNHWCGMTNVVLLPPALVFDFAPRTNISYVGDSKSDRIDFFNVKSSSC